MFFSSYIPNSPPASAGLASRRQPCRPRRPRVNPEIFSANLARRPTSSTPSDVLPVVPAVLARPTSSLRDSPRRRRLLLQAPPHHPAAVHCSSPTPATAPHLRPLPPTPAAASTGRPRRLLLPAAPRRPRCGLLCAGRRRSSLLCACPPLPSLLSICARATPLRACPLRRCASDLCPSNSLIS